MHDRTREMAKDGTLMQFGRRSRGKLFGFAGMEIAGATELLEKCKAKVVVHKAEAEFIKGLSSSDMIKTDNGDKVDVGGVGFSSCTRPARSAFSSITELSQAIRYSSTHAAASIFREAIPSRCITA
jgi:hypothetical protein